VADLPTPYATKGVSNSPTVVAKPADAWPKAPAGFKVERYAEGLDYPREIKTAPNGDMFVAENHSGEVEVFRGISSDGKPVEKSTFATGLKNNFGIAFYPLGANPKWVYVGNTNSVVRFPYKNGDLKASGHLYRTVKQEIRENLLTRMRAGQERFPGIVGFDQTVLPHVERALIAGHDIILLGERGQGKTRLIRTLGELLDEWTPVVTGCEINDHPYAPVCRQRGR